MTFVAAGHWSVEPLDWGDLGAWLSRVEPADALVEVARWLGLALAVYVAAVSLTALLAEACSLVRLPRLTGMLRAVVRIIAIPALRRRLLELTAVATVTASMFQSPAAAISASRPATALVVDSPPVPPATVSVRGQFEGFGAVANEPAPTAVAVHKVQRSDTLWDIAQRHYGHVDAGVVAAVVAANPQITDPDLILVGWEVALPELAAVAEPPAMPPPPEITGEATWAVVQVQKGDTLWEIVERHYGHADAELVYATVDANPAIENPNLIFPKQLITLPPAPDSAAAPTEGPSPPVPVPAGPTATAPPAPPTATAPPPATPAPTPPATSIPPPTATVPTSNPTASTPNPPEHASAATDPALQTSAAPASDPQDDEGGVSLASLIGWTGGAGLAAALLALAARRRRRLPLAQRHRRPSRRALELAVAMRETDNVPLVELASNALRVLATRLRPRPGEPTPVPRLLRLADDTAELVWDTPNPGPIAPWTTSDGGWSWNLPRVAALEPSDAPAPCPTLVTIGRRDGCDVLLNLESFGALTVTGSDDEVDRLVRSMATELAASEFADASTVLMAGGPRLPGAPDHARAVEPAEALGWLRDRYESATALLAHRRLTSLFSLRARSKSTDAHEPVVVIVEPSQVSAGDLQTIIDLANGDLGTVVIVIGEHPSLSTRIVCADGQVEIEPLGLVLDAAGLPDEITKLIEDYVPEGDPELDEPGEDGFEDGVDAGSVVADHLDLIESQHRAENVPLVDDEDDWDVELKVLGQVRCVGARERLSPVELHLAIYLALHRSGENSDTIATMIWPNGVREHSVSNAMASLRRKLGTGVDGEPLFPLGREHDYLYRLSPRVMTDWDRFVGLMKRAEPLPPEEALPLLDKALTLVDGPPFRADKGYSWAYTDGTATLITETIRAVGGRAAELHLLRGETERASNARAAIAKTSDASTAEDSLLA
jgi:phage tail protein X